MEPARLDREGILSRNESDRQALPDSLVEEVAGFVHHLSTERRQSPHTCQGYQRDLTRLMHGRAGPEAIRPWM